MPPTSPLIERIAAAIATQLGTMAAGDDYHNTPAGVERPPHYNGYTPESKLLVVQQGPGDVVGEEITSNVTILTWDQVFEIDCMIQQSNTSTTSGDTLINKFAADVQKCLMQPVAALDALTTEKHVDGVLPLQFADSSFEGVKVSIRIIYRVSEDDPAEQR